MEKISKIIYTLLVVLSLSSCLKDKELIGPDADGSIANIVEFGNVAAPASGVTSSIPMYALSYDLDPAAVLNIRIKCVGAEKAKGDITVKIEVDNSLLDEYNSQNSAEFVALPSDRYNLPTTEVVIKGGEREAVIPLNLMPNMFTFDEEYALGFKISSVSSGEISGNFGRVIYNISGKNVYDGVFNYKTSAATSLVPNANKTVELITVGANRVKLSPGLLGTYSNEVYYNIDPATNRITVECPSLGVQSPQDTRSVWDPATKTLKVFWKQGNGGRTFEETFTFQSSR